MEISLHTISAQLANIIHSEVSNKIKEIAEHENLDVEYIMKKYMSSINISPYKEVKKRTRTLPPKDMQCQGRKNDFTQCTRKKKDDTDFCQSHLKNLKFGRVDDENDEYIPMWQEDINGKVYLVDNENMVYTNDTKSPVLIGKKTDMGEIEVNYDVFSS